MDSIKEYVLSVICSAVLCGITEMLLNKKTTTGQLAKILCGLIVTITVISPLKQISLPDFAEYFETISEDANIYVNDGTMQAKTEAIKIIKSQTEAYILDKANKMHCNIDVEITVSAGEDLVPCEAIITGSVSPYAKEVLSTYMEESIGIIKERQIWK